MILWCIMNAKKGKKSWLARNWEAGRTDGDGHVSSRVSKFGRHFLGRVALGIGAGGACFFPFTDFTPSYLFTRRAPAWTLTDTLFRSTGPGVARVHLGT